jgi:hypothetical protein
MFFTLSLQTSKNIYVEVGEYFNKAIVDYETIQIAFYHLIENALKYSKTKF